MSEPPTQPVPLPEEYSAGPSFYQIFARHKFPILIVGILLTAVFLYFVVWPYWRGRPAAQPSPDDATPTAAPIKANAEPPQIEAGEFDSGGIEHNDRLILVYSPHCMWSVKFINETWSKLAGEVDTKGEAVNAAVPSKVTKETVAAMKELSPDIGFPTLLYSDRSTLKPIGQLQGHRDVQSVKAFLEKMRSEKKTK